MEMQTKERSVTTVVYLSLMIQTEAVTYCRAEKDQQSQRHKSLRKERPNGFRPGLDSIFDELQVVDCLYAVAFVM